MLERLGYAVQLWSVTSFTELAREAEACERDNRLHPLEPERIPYIQSLFEKESGPVIAATDFMKTLANTIARWMPPGYTALGTDGFGMSESRATLREHFEISPRQIARAALIALFRSGGLKKASFVKQLSEVDVGAE
jgi:pyruvate dehydrogenase E1 component